MFHFYTANVVVVVVVLFVCLFVFMCEVGTHHVFR